MSYPFGIDLGTTNSAIALFNQGGKPEIVSVDGQRIVRSAVYFPREDPDLKIVGESATQALTYEPESVVIEAKRKMGVDKNGSPHRFEVRDRAYTPQQISSFVLEKLVNEASKIYGEIREAVVTVPASFDDSRRRATIQAGELIGLQIPYIINEPTAAALAYASSGRALTGNIMIYDLGGGTFDVTIAKVRNDEVDCLTSEGDFYLGGCDFDQAIYSMICEEYKEQFGCLPSVPPSDRNPYGEGQYYGHLAVAERLKVQLSSSSTAQDLLNGPAGNGRIRISRLDFEERISHLIAKTEMLVETALENCGFAPSDINYVLLVGGSTRVPVVRESITRLMGQSPLEAVNPDEAVALGASVYSAKKNNSLNPLQQNRVNDIIIADVTNKYYGILAINRDAETEKVEKRNSIILQKDTKIPCEGTQRFATVADNQQYINVEITESGTPEEDLRFVNVVHSAQFGPLPAGRPAGQPVRATYRYDSNQIMHCEIVDEASGRKYEHDLSPEKLDTDGTAGKFTIE